MQQNSSAGYRGDAIRGKPNMAMGGSICQWTKTKFGRAQLDQFENLSDMFQKNLVSEEMR